MGVLFRYRYFPIAVLFALAGIPPRSLAQVAEPSALRLSELVQEALLQNPEIQGAYARVDAAKLRIPQAGALPSPIVMYELNNIGITGISIGQADMSMTGFSFVQGVPFPGKRGLRTQVATASASVDDAKAQVTGWTVVSQLKIAYYDLALAHQALEIIDQSGEVLRLVSQTAEARYRVGNGLQQDILKAQVELSRLAERRTQLQQRRLSAEAVINRVLARPFGTPVGRPAGVSRTPFSTSLDTLLALVDRQGPLLQTRERDLRRQESEVALARRDSYPDFDVSAGWLTRGRLPDMYQLKIGVELPLYYRRKQRNRVAEAQAMVTEARAEREATHQMLLSDLFDSYTMAKTANEQADLFEQAIIPQAALSLQSAIAGYEVGKVDFLTVLDNILSLLDDKLTGYERVVAYQQALVRLEPLIGATLVE